MPETSTHLVPLHEFAAARERLVGRVARTPMLTSSTAARWIQDGSGIRLGDGTLYLKAEHLQRTGSFKARGMTNRIATLSPDVRERGAITLSAGNAGQAYAYAGRAEGVAITVVMPAGAVASKVAACHGYGARVVLHGEHVGDAFVEMERIRDAEGLTYVPPFDDAMVIAGNGSVGAEILEDLPDVDLVVVGVGGGGLISGVAAAIREARPSVRVYGVEPETSNAVSLAVAAGRVVPIEPRSVADGLGAPFAGTWTLAMVQHYLEGIVLIDDPTILAGLRFAVERLKQVVEPAGAAALAAVLSGRIPIRDGERVAVVVSGGNVAVDRLGDLIAAAGQLPRGVTEPPEVPPPEPEPGAIAPPAVPVAPLVPAGAGPLVPAGAPVAKPAADPTVPSARRLIGASFDLLSGASDDMRQASFYVGAIVFGTAGGYAIAAWAFEVAGTHSTVREIADAMAGPLGGWLGLLGMLALTGIFVAAIESRAMAVSLLGARSTGRPLGVRAALARSRATFWKIVLGAVLVAIPVGLAQGLTSLAIGAAIPNAAELGLGILAVVGALIGAPFAYVLTGIVLGDVDPFEAIRRSFRVFGARKGAAVLVALFESLAQLLILFGVSAGLDIALRLFSGLGLSVDSGLAGILLATLMIAAGVFAAGTLIFTVSALSIAPQVVMFVALTHATFGLDHVRPGGDWDPAVRRRGQPRFRRFTRPMLLGFAGSVIGLVGALTELLR